MTAYLTHLLAAADKVEDTVTISGPTFADYRGVDPTTGMEFLLTVHDDGTREIRSRPIGADGWTVWSPPVELVVDRSYGGSL